MSDTPPPIPAHSSQVERRSGDPVGAIRSGIMLIGESGLFLYPVIPFAPTQAAHRLSAGIRHIRAGD